MESRGRMRRPAGSSGEAERREDIIRADTLRLAAGGVEQTPIGENLRRGARRARFLDVDMTFETVRTALPAEKL